MLYGPCLLPIAKKSSLLQKADVSADKETYFFLVVTLLAWLERWALNYRKEGCVERLLVVNESFVPLHAGKDLTKAADDFSKCFL
jgi:hypothetical protein